MSIEHLFSLKGEVAIVTGGSGQLGSAYVEVLRSAGASVAIVDVKPPKGKESEKGNDAFLGPVATFLTDITNKASVAKTYEEILRTFGAPSILVNNAGLDSPPNASAQENGLFEDYPEASWDAVVDSHLKGTLLMSQEFIRQFKLSKKEHGSIINISSMYGVVSPDQSLYDYRRRKGEVFFKPVAYSVAKSGMLNFTRWLAEYGAPSGIRANCLVLGGVFNGQAEEFLQEFQKRAMLGRMADPSEYCAAVLFLASYSASSYMTGSIMTLDGGWTAR